MITVKNKYSHYEIYVDGKFYCSCDCGELREVMEEIENETNNYN